MNFIRVEGFPNYVIHPAGTILRIWKHHTREIKTWKDKKGYMRVGLCNNGKKKKFLVHRLLALNFIHNDDPENNIDIDHLDAVRDNNSLSNLEWVTHAENNRRRYLNNPAAEITKGGISKHGNSWQWRYRMKTKTKNKTMKSNEDLQKFRKETLLKYNINL